MKRILVVDDDRTTLRMIRLQLRGPATRSTPPPTARGPSPGRPGSLRPRPPRRLDARDGRARGARADAGRRRAAGGRDDRGRRPADGAEGDSRARVPLRHEANRAGGAHRRRGSGSARRSRRSRSSRRSPTGWSSSCRATARRRTRIQAFLSQLDTDLPEHVRADVGLAFREMLMNAIEWGGGSTRARPCASPICARGACCSTASRTPARASASGDLTHAAVSNPPSRPSTTPRARGERPAAGRLRPPDDAAGRGRADLQRGPQRGRVREVPRLTPGRRARADGGASGRAGTTALAAARLYGRLGVRPWARPRRAGGRCLS